MKLTSEQRYELIEMFTSEDVDVASVETIAESYGIDIDTLREFTYRCTQKLIKDFLFAGKSHGDVPDGMDPNELKLGEKIEMEHTNNKNIARKICLDHLAECPSYYSKLSIMEKSCKRK